MMNTKLLGNLINDLLVFKGEPRALKVDVYEHDTSTYYRCTIDKTQVELKLNDEASWIDVTKGATALSKVIGNLIESKSE